MSSGLGALVTYSLLVVLWGAVAVLYARQFHEAKGERVLRLVLAFFIADAVRTVFESAYFGLLWSANYGLLPESFKVLGRPELLTMVKWFTVLLGGVVLVAVARVWIPREVRARKEQREAETRLREELENSLREVRDREERFRLVAQVTRDILWDEDLRTGGGYLAPRFWELLGYDQTTDKRVDVWEKAVSAEDRAAFQRAMYGLFDNNTPAELRFRATHRDGSTVHLHSQAQLVFDAEGRATRLVGVTRDVTREVQAEEQRVQSQKLEGLGLLAGGIAHDFNNLLTVVSSSLASLAREGARGDAMQTAEEAVQRAAGLTQQLLGYAGRSSFEQRSLDLNTVVGSIGGLLSATAPANVKLKHHLAAGLPGVQGNEGQLQQVVMNLVTNASEAVAQGDGEVTLRTELVLDPATPPGARTRIPRGRVVLLTVEDTGAGMSAEVLSRIFDPYFSTKGPGRGLGMASSLGILRAHDAGFAIESEIGRGTRCRVFFPALETPAQAVVPLRKSLERLNARVLLVDDEALLRRSARRLLTLLGCTVTEAANGVEAVAAVRANPGNFDVVLMDMTMPEMDGLAATKLINSLSPALPVVLSSGYSTLELPPGVHSLAKPWDARRIETLLRKITSPS